MYQIDSTLTFAQINENVRRFVRKNNKTEAKVTITGKFPIAKLWNEKLVKKEIQQTGIEVTDAKVIDINSLWITVQTGKTKYFLKITGATGSYKIE